MFTRFIKFWIENTKLTLVLIILIISSGIFSRVSISKQYNPTIEAPAFMVSVQTTDYNYKQINKLIVEPLENIIWEIEWVDDIYWYVQPNLGSVMVSFEVWENKEDATIRLYNKIFSNIRNKTIWVSQPIIESIDPDELPVYTFAITSSNTWTTETELRKIWLDIVDHLKKIDSVKWFYIIWWEKKEITIFLDIDKVRAYNIPLIEIPNKIKNSNIWMYLWETEIWITNNKIHFDWQFKDLEQIKNLVIWNYDGKLIKLNDVADVFFGKSEEIDSTRYYDSIENFEYWNTVFIWISKKDWTNSINVVSSIKKWLKDIENKLPKQYVISEVQDLGKKAKVATDMLIINLFQSIIIVLLVLTLVLWFRNAINVAISIPITLSIVFTYSFIVWDNINRISLFALILVLWMLVDDATVVVENINRKLNENKSLNWESKINIIIKAIKEVELGVVLSTVTRLLAFGAMFFVSWMMWEYMWPIPKYAIVAMITSTIVALSINPFLTNVFYINKSKKTNKISLLFSKIFRIIRNKLNFKKIYFNFIWYFLNDKKPLRIIFFKLFFWIVLLSILIIPPAMLVFKMRMLPKSDQNQIFIRIDLPSDTTYTSTKNLSKNFNSFLLKEYWSNNLTDEIENSKIIESISTRNWHSPMPDFSNIFRNSMFRDWKNYISMRINFVDNRQREISSERRVIENRNKIKDFVTKNNPQASVRILEEPPGPPTQATYQLKIQWNDIDDYSNIESLTSWIFYKLQNVFQQQDIVDIYTSVSHYQTKYTIKLDHEKAAKLWIDSKTVAYTLKTIFNGMNVDVYHDVNAKEEIKINLTLNQDQKQNQNIFSKILIPNNKWWFINLEEIAKIDKSRNEPIVYSDSKRLTSYIYWEMWDNSIIYSMIMTIRTLLDENFWEWKYDIISRNLYNIEIQDKLTMEKYKITFWWEWKLTIDTFADLWLAMIIAFLTIYFVMVAQFKWFWTWWVVMISFLLWFFGVFPIFTMLYLWNNEYFSATSMIWVIALAWIVVWNVILLLEYIMILLKEKKFSLQEAIITAWWTRMVPILITSLTTILWVTTIIWDPVWSWLARAIIGWLLSSAILTPIVLPIFLYPSIRDNKELFDKKWNKSVISTCEPFVCTKDNKELLDNKRN